jgi:hypothetical protein
MLGLVPVLAGVWATLPFEKSIHLPRSWAYAFLAALTVTMAQVIYQLRAPEIVRRSTLDGYVRNARQDYADQPSPERLEQADVRLSLATPLDYSPVDRYIRFPQRYSHYYPQGMRIAEAWEHVWSGEVAYSTFFIEARFGVYVLREALLARPHPTPPPGYDFSRNRLKEYEQNLGLSDEQSEKARLLHNITKVGYGARYEYLEAADQRPVAMIAASLLYVIAIGLIVVITVEQTLSVLRAAGWLM